MFFIGLRARPPDHRFSFIFALHSNHRFPSIFNRFSWVLKPGPQITDLHSCLIGFHVFSDHAQKSHISAIFDRISLVFSQCSEILNVICCDHILIRRVIELSSEATLFIKTVELLKQSISFHAKPLNS